MENKYNQADKKSYDEYINAFDQDERMKIKEIFDLFDKNLDGEIDLKELKFIMNCKIEISHMYYKIFIHK